jgi:hypothetical protein
MDGEAGGGKGDVADEFAAGAGHSSSVFGGLNIGTNIYINELLNRCPTFQ